MKNEIDLRNFPFKIKTNSIHISSDDYFKIYSDEYSYRSSVTSKFICIYEYIWLHNGVTEVYWGINAKSSLPKKIIKI